ncbi:MAG: hypothetical protein ACRD2A_22330, partial [Vicinamibacterales bacterium]
FRPLPRAAARRVRSVGPVLQTACLAQRATQQKLDLRVQASQVVVGPALHRLEQLGINPEEERFSI